MKYFKVHWLHNDPDDPTIIYTEIDDTQWEHRKVEVFSNGRQGFADHSEEFGGSALGEEPWPDLMQIASDPEFELEEIQAEEFEQIWLTRRMKNPN